MKSVTSKFINQIVEDSFSTIETFPIPLICEIVFDIDRLIYDHLSEKEKVFYGINERELKA